MATKAELQAELAELRKQLATAPPEPATARPPRTSEDAAGGGFAAEDIAALGEHLSGMLGTLPRNRPLTTVIGAFAVGFVLGRMIRS